MTGPGEIMCCPKCNGTMGFDQMDPMSQPLFICGCGHVVPVVPDDRIEYGEWCEKE